MQDVSSDKSRRFFSTIDSSELGDRATSAKSFISNGHQPWWAYFPRFSRNAWFRLSTYERFKPSISDQTHSVNYLMRWGRQEKH